MLLVQYSIDYILMQH